MILATVSIKPDRSSGWRVLVGTASWVAAATVFRLPVSTTQALVGSLLGAGVLFSATSVQWRALLPEVVYPMLLSVAVAYVISVVLAVASTAGVRLLWRRRAVIHAGAGGDTPKIVAVGAFALVPAGMELWQILLVVTVAMALGSVVCA